MAVAHLTVISSVLVLAHLFVEVPRKKNSEATISVFESSCHLSLPV